MPFACQHSRFIFFPCKTPEVLYKCEFPYNGSLVGERYKKKNTFILLLLNTAFECRSHVSIQGGFFPRKPPEVS